MHTTTVGAFARRLLTVAELDLYGTPLPPVGPIPVWKSKFYGAFALNHCVVLHAIDATPARWRGDAGSSPLDRARTAALRREMT